ncbi:ribosome biogenesis protein SLX9-domain-containing protein [Scleroderma yunnanense]
MPKEHRSRLGGHQPSVKLAKRHFAAQTTSSETLEIGTVKEASGQEILESLAKPPPSVSKKEKQQRKHEALVDRVKSTQSPYSSAQRRRFNRKMREQVGSGMAEMGDAISSLEEKEVSSESAKRPNDGQANIQMKTRQIGEGRGNPLTRSQRRRALEVERLRHPLILSDPRFSNSPFETIRIHAQNTLEKHMTSS